MNLLQIGQITNQYKILRELGKGKYSTVYLACDTKDNNELVALKVTSNNELQKHNGLIKQLVNNEIEALKRAKDLNNQNIIEYINDYRENNCIILVEEFCNSDTLTKFWQNKGKQFEEEEAVGLLKQLLNGFRGLHSQNIIHRDIKMDNILLQNESIIKIADLGFCDILQNQNQKLRLSLGSFGTEAPEILNEKPYGLESDIFSIGVIFYQLLFGEYPFPMSFDAFMKSCQKGNINYQLNGVKISEQAKDLINKMLQYDPQRRITFIEIYDHELIRKKELSTIGVSRIRINADAINIEQNAKFYKENYQQLQKSIVQIEQTTKAIPFPKFQQIKIIEQDEQYKQNINQIQEGQQIYEEKQQIENQISQEINVFNKYINQIFYVCNTMFEIINQQKIELSHVVYLLCLHALQNFETLFEEFTIAKQNYNNYKLPKDYLSIEKIINDMIEILKHQKEQCVQDLKNLNQQTRQLYQQEQINIKTSLKTIIQYELQKHINEQMPIVYRHLINCYKYFNLNTLYEQYNVSIQEEFKNPVQLIGSAKLLAYLNQE